MFFSITKVESEKPVKNRVGLFKKLIMSNYYSFDEQSIADALEAARKNT